MIDLHSHILPNIDDGAKTMEETYCLIDEARRAGVKEIVVTPHYIEGYYEKSRSLIEEVVREISDQVKDVKLHIGNEVYLTENVMKLLDEKKIATINDSNYLLFEMPMNIKPLYLYDVVYEMLRNNLIPILAHPERYIFIQEDPNLIGDLLEKGVLMQANYGSITGRYGRKAEILVKKLLKKDMIHFLGSDVHRKNTIYLQMPKIKEQLDKIVGPEKVKELTTINPTKVIKNEPINITEISKVKYTFIEQLLMK